jgi:hypothetical protein
VALLVLELKPACRGVAIVVEHAQAHRHCRLHREQDRRVRPETQILRALAHVERDGCLTPPRFARVDQRDSVFELESVQIGGHGRSREQLDIEKPIGASLDVLVLAEMLLLHAVG